MREREREREREGDPERDMALWYLNILISIIWIKIEYFRIWKTY